MNLRFGKNTTLYHHAVLEIAEEAQVHIGDNFTLSYGAVISGRYNIEIGDNVMIGEYTSIRDTTHQHDTSLVPYCQQADKSEKIIIGNNVWIGRGSIILPGAVIEDGVVVGADSVVKGRLKANCLYAGAPVKFIKNMARENEHSDYSGRLLVASAFEPKMS